MRKTYNKNSGTDAALYEAKQHSNFQNIRVLHETGFQYAGKAAPSYSKLENTIHFTRYPEPNKTGPSVPSHPSQVRAVNPDGTIQHLEPDRNRYLGQGIISKPPATQESFTGNLVAGARRVDRAQVQDGQPLPEAYPKDMMLGTVQLSSDERKLLKDSQGRRVVEVLGYHMVNSGSQHVQNQLPALHQGVNANPPQHLVDASNKFAQEAAKAHHEGNPALGAPQGSSLQNGEFRAMAQRQPGGTDITYLSYKEGLTAAMPPDHLYQSAHVDLHSHPTVPEMGDTLRGVDLFHSCSYPSHADYLLAANREMVAALPGRNVAPADHIMMHGVKMRDGKLMGANFYQFGTGNGIQFEKVATTRHERLIAVEENLLLGKKDPKDFYHPHYANNPANHAPVGDPRFAAGGLLHKPDVGEDFTAGSFPNHLLHKPKAAGE